MRTASDDATQTYLNGVFGTEDAHQKLIRETGPAPLRGMMLSPHEGALLAWLARSIDAKRILEIGSFVGYSASWLLRALPANGRLHCIEYDALHATTFLDNLAEPVGSNRLELHIGPALEILPLLSSQGPFDVVFIDADKRNYPTYAKWAATHLRVGGLLIADNSLSFGQVQVASDTPPDNTSARAGWEAMRLLNQVLADSPEWDTTLLPTAGGMTVARKLAQTSKLAPFGEYI